MFKPKGRETSLQGGRSRDLKPDHGTQLRLKTPKLVDYSTPIPVCGYVLTLSTGSSQKRYFGS